MELKKIFRNFNEVKVSTVNLNDGVVTVQVIADNHLLDFRAKTTCTEISDDLVTQVLRLHERKIQHIHVE